MSTVEITGKVKELKELKRMAEELNAEIEAIEDTLKAIMGDSESLIAGEYKLTYKTVQSTRLDTTAFKKAHPDIAALYTKETSYRRFTIL